MEKNQKQIMKVLKDMGYTPEIDADGDICIYLEMKHFYFFVAEIRGHQVRQSCSSSVCTHRGGTGGAGSCHL